MKRTPSKYLEPMFPGGGIELKSIPGHHRMRVISDFVWKGTRKVTVPKGYVFDGASIPRVFWRVIGGPWGPYRDAAAVHDYLYSHGHLAFPDEPDADGNRRPSITREEADNIFHRIMLEVGISRFKASLMRRAVRLGGGKAWKDYRRAQ